MSFIITVKILGLPSIRIRISPWTTLNDIQKTISIHCYGQSYICVYTPANSTNASSVLCSAVTHNDHILFTDMFNTENAITFTTFLYSSEVDAFQAHYRNTLDSGIVLKKLLLENYMPLDHMEEILPKML